MTQDENIAKSVADLQHAMRVRRLRLVDSTAELNSHVQGLCRAIDGDYLDDTARRQRFARVDMAITSLNDQLNELKDEYHI